jgi:hypothetical protein
VVFSVEGRAPGSKANGRRNEASNGGAGHPEVEKLNDFNEEA